ncbi:MAG: hypothetical protein K0Q68_1198 [Moraxellaceae bacterium]|jgi:hypothetical protein|nr:hypothetical protein [Moraxellaceae bacterium]
MTQPGHDGEGRRQAYLAALGIPLWSARQALPGALPGAPLAFVPFLAEVATLPVVAAAPATMAAPVAAQGAVTAPPVTADAAAPPEARRERPLASPAAEAPASTGARPAALPGGMPRLSCSVRSLGPGWTAVIALDDAPDLAALEYSLLDNIALALGAVAPPTTSGEALRWPLNRNPAFDHGRDAMLVWLRHALRLPPGGCVVFGETLAGHVQSALPEREVIAAPALGELLASAAAKRQLALDLLAASPQARDD